MITLFHAGKQLIKVRGVMLLSLACAVASIWFGLDLSQTYGLRSADGGMLAPLPVRLAWGIGVGALGVVFAAGMWLYGRCYVSRIELDRHTSELSIYTVRFIGIRKQVIETSDLLGSSHHEGGFSGGGRVPSVHAPWSSVRLGRRRLPPIVDQQGVFLQEGHVNELFG